jgi:hypothetical protein
MQRPPPPGTIDLAMPEENLKSREMAPRLRLCKRERGWETRLSDPCKCQNFRPLRQQYPHGRRYFLFEAVTQQ